MLLQQLLNGKLLEYPRDTLKAQTQNLSRIHNSSAYRNCIEMLLDGFHDYQKSLNGPLNGTLQARGFGKKFPRHYVLSKGIPIPIVFSLP